MAIKKVAAALAAFIVGAVASAGAALADKPREWQTNLQDAASPLMDRIHSFHSLLLYIIFGVAVFVLALLLWVMIRYNARANPTPSKTTHNTMIEVVWTVVPILILVVIAVPSFRLLYYADKAPKEDAAKGETGAVITIKARGHQWYWSYVYEASYQIDAKGFPVKENGKPVDALKGAHFRFSSRIACIGGKDADDQKNCAAFEKANGRKPVRLLDVDYPIVIPVNTTVRVLVQGMDVIHSFAMPSMGVKVDANPGRLNETWLQAKKVGWYYGQCSELCGANHGFMPIAVKVVTREEYDKWLAAAKTNPDFEKVEEPKRADAASHR
ncbi:MAG: cytochrome c oxidase subunit II [Rhodospirillaceae bacterium]|nr:cytochrome c oxidase subunit II [Rhodospirillaceae bacterium]